MLDLTRPEFCQATKGVVGKCKARIARDHNTLPLDHGLQECRRGTEGGQAVRLTDSRSQLGGGIVGVLREAVWKDGYGQSV